MLATPARLATIKSSPTGTPSTYTHMKWVGFPISLYFILLKLMLNICILFWRSFVRPCPCTYFHLFLFIMPGCVFFFMPGCVFFFAGVSTIPAVRCHAHAAVLPVAMVTVLPVATQATTLVPPTTAAQRAGLTGTRTPLCHFDQALMNLWEIMENNGI